MIMFGVMEARPGVVYLSHLSYVTSHLHKHEVKAILT